MTDLHTVKNKHTNKDILVAIFAQVLLLLHAMWKLPLNAIVAAKRQRLLADEPLFVPDVVIVEPRCAPTELDSESEQEMPDTVIETDTQGQ